MIAAFVTEKINAYIAGGMKPENAARFTSGELGAIYRGNHYSRDASGALRITPLPEDMPIEAARTKCNEAIKEILNYRKEETVKSKAKPRISAAAQEKSGFEKMAEYARDPA